MVPTLQGISKNSRAWKQGLRNEQKLLAADGVPVVDFIDMNFLAGQSSMSLLLEDPDGTRREILYQKSELSPLGFDTSLGYPRERQCRNRCVFCFVDQLPAGMRSELYVKDDDWRYSAIFGNFVTLTNVNAKDMERLIARKVSPLYVSVHATQAPVRAMMLGNPRAGDILSLLERLAKAGIQVHAQVVLCPGLNDGPVLKQTLEDLYRLWPGVRSVAVVPVGLTRYRQGLQELRPLTQNTAQEAVRDIEAFAAMATSQTGSPFAFASDEMYLLAGMACPSYPDGCHTPQSGNGVGLVCEFVQGVEAALLNAPVSVPPQNVTLVTGASFAPILREQVGRIAAVAQGFSAQVIAVENTFFGSSVVVAGLLTGQDIARTLEGIPLGDAVWVPDASLRGDEGLFLDGWTMDGLEQALGVPVVAAPDDGYAFVERVLGMDGDE